MTGRITEFALLSPLWLIGLSYSKHVSMLTAGHEHWDGSHREQGLHVYTWS